MHYLAVGYVPPGGSSNRNLETRKSNESPGGLCIARQAVFGIFSETQQFMQKQIILMQFILEIMSLFTHNTNNEKNSPNLEFPLLRVWIMSLPLSTNALPLIPSNKTLLFTPESQFSLWNFVPHKVLSNGSLGFPLPFHIHAKTNFSKKKIYFSFTKVWTHNQTNVILMHNHSTNSCFMIILIIIRFYYHSTWSCT